MNPKVSIIMATFNRAHFIVETLLSIQNQTFKDWECIIIDDGGIDNTKEVIASILEEDDRFQYVKRSGSYKKGLPGCRNYGLDLVKGERVIFFDDDDIVHPQNLELCMLELEDDTVSFCRYIRSVFFEDFDYEFDYSKKYNSFYIGIKDLEKILKNEIPFNSCAIMWKATCFKNNRFAENLMYAEEWELYSRIISSGFRGISIEKCLFYGRKHLNSNTGEFYRHNPIRRESFANAILLVIQNLKEKQLLSDSLKRYFVTLSKEFTEYNLFNAILNVMDLSTFEKLKWQLFYLFYPIRLPFYKIKKALQKK
ncbi:Glycosyltransferase involved in cell wall bisynthesis [Flavobacterium fluvii]|uniref:Glycosyltransferase involved in cell wall bisynthesis n=1 Tax=Flavobacterium fluvii TaxID=468056 RepID=A0A1M5IRF6_9FLAO|nr:glycosyltransferase family 2 protein [Flavobacterium fluvii]SHG30363.1 Glycosyltransferase involved in cell wall bisynthesis [Flavobacterium fluvii]